MNRYQKVPGAVIIKVLSARRPASARTTENRFMRSSRLLSLAVLLSGGAAGAAEPPTAEFFEKNVRPVLAEKCWSCHGPKKQQGGLRLDSRAALLKGSDGGAVVVAGQPDKSPLVRAVRREGDNPMPPRGHLNATEVEALASWVRLGVPWPEAGPTALTATAEEVRRKHWAFRPVQKPALPAVRDTAWVRTPVDAFIRAGLEAKGLAPAAAADRVTLIRRLSFDLTGLPPTPEEVDAFLADQSSEAYEKLVDRLLASPHYGERWARHWLDVARYADTKGYVFTDERRFPYAYTYRDWVIRAFNEDLPYDQFLVQQLAADLLPPGEDKRPLAAMGFLTLGRRFLNNEPDIIDDRIDVTTRGLLGLTVACARCHDHKFDPIPQKDYYSLYGVFASSVEPKELPPLPAPTTAERAAFEAELKKRTEVVEKYREAHKAELAARNRKIRDELRRLQKKVDEWRVTGAGSPPRAMVLNDRPSPVDPHVFLRGNPNNPGPAVPRQFLEVVAGPSRKPFAQGSGRLELARAIAGRDNPLTARVMVNRIWQHHFGQGLVRTPGNFGLRGEPPTHPELLDWLAATFVDQGWSVKKLHRLLLLSSTYRQASVADARTVEVDPENRLWGRTNRRRLEFEPLRDALLAVAGRLDPQAGGAAVELTTAPFATRRSVYGFIDRQNLPGLFRTFDLASPDASTPERHVTTVPQQALFLMNSPFVAEQARHFAGRADVAGQPSDEARIRRMHRLTYGRDAEPEEVALGLRFVAGVKATAWKLGPWEQYAQVLLMSNEFAMVD
jgi:hypothetical protein